MEVFPMAHVLRSGPAQDCDLVKPINTPPISAIDEHKADKAVHCLVYVLKKLGGVADLYTLLKIIYSEGSTIRVPVGPAAGPFPDAPPTTLADAERQHIPGALHRPAGAFA
jgi:hypothetical protein